MDANVRINFVVDTKREFARTLALSATTESNRISSDKGTDFLSCLFPRHDRISHDKNSTRDDIKRTTENSILNE